jgi:hypothetical protein
MADHAGSRPWRAPVAPAGWARAAAVAGLIAVVLLLAKQARPLVAEAAWWFRGGTPAPELTTLD